MANKSWQSLMIATLIFGAMGPLTSVVAADQVTVDQGEPMQGDGTRSDESTSKNKESTNADESGTFEVNDDVTSEKPVVTEQDAQPAENTPGTDVVEDSPTTDTETEVIDTNESPNTETADTNETPAVNPEENTDEAETSETSEIDPEETNTEAGAEDTTETAKTEPEGTQKSMDEAVEEKQTKAEVDAIQAPSSILFAEDKGSQYHATALDATGSQVSDVEWQLSSHIKDKSDAKKSPLDFFAPLPYTLNPGNIPINTSDSQYGLYTEDLKIGNVTKRIQVGGLASASINRADIEKQGLSFTIDAASSLPASEKWDYQWLAMENNQNGGGQDPIKLSAYQNDLDNISGTLTTAPTNAALALHIKGKSDSKFISLADDNAEKVVVLMLELTNNEGKKYYSNYAQLQVRGVAEQSGDLELTNVPSFANSVNYSSTDITDRKASSPLNAGNLSVTDTRTPTSGKNWILSAEATSFIKGNEAIPFDFRFQNLANEIDFTLSSDHERKAVLWGMNARNLNTPLSVIYTPKPTTTFSEGQYEATIEWHLAASTTPQGKL